MRAATRITTALVAVGVIGGGVYAVPRLLDKGAATTEQRLQAKPPGGKAIPGAAPFTLVATGDIIPYPSIIQRAADDAGGTPGDYDFRKILAGVKPIVSAADLAICHHEIPYGKPGGPYTGYPAFKAPHQLADALKDAGYDSCSTASNHSLDDGFDGLSRTLDHLDRVGLKHVGSARRAEEATAPALLSAGGAKVAQLDYTYGTNGIPLPAGKPWAVNLIDQARIIADARAARAAGAHVVVLSVHWGTEWQTAPDQQQKDLAQALTASRGADGLPDIDLIIGTHNHVPQPYEKVNGTWVVYGMGDQIASFYEAEKARGNMSSIPRFTFAPAAAHPGRWEVVKAEYLTQYSDMGPPFRVVCASCAAGDGGEGGASAAKRAEYARVDKEVTAAVTSRGAAGQGLTHATR
ncbi:poly-gamma-glutamate synthesis protein (capsule biosynthesis protein) [Streptomyces sp. Ag109_G2-6]|uniref:CapA family protein n=1 Tax=Streptomyces sp. Ag109_G2-6 TaxID=2485154 RepID=UPI000F4D3E84|nr:CapA family protein [Streptomyces sp. Ag109_G2-6]RPF39893.1 poly-gamma-glutamate synthesis protein (capsule biosynthesis protein) [Streptomyces sp. Ag109_G2-6]